MTYDIHNIFAKILKNEIPCKKVYEDEFALAFDDINPTTPIHVLVIPKTEHISFHSFCSNASQKEICGFFNAVNKTISKLGLPNGYRIITNYGDDASQTIHHFHVHILGGKHLGGLISGDENHN
jgi:histidine triad (HIT) family protein